LTTEVYSLGRIGAARGMAAEEVHTQNRRLWVCLRKPERDGVFSDHAPNRGGPMRRRFSSCSLVL
jgi:hypothetical protein